MSGPVAGLDLGGSAVKAWVVEDGALLAEASVPTPVRRPAVGRVEVDPDAWEAAARDALAQAVERAGRPPMAYLGLTVSSLRQGFVLLDGAGAALGPAVLNSDGRGAGHEHVLEGRYALTGHWPAAELTLPKLLHVRAAEPVRWATTARVLFVHDWLLHRLGAAPVTEASYACAGGMADVAARTWAVDLLDECGVGTARLAPVVEAGTVVGELTGGWALPPSLPLVSGSGDTQLAALGAGGLAPGTVTVVAGSSTPVQVAVDRAPQDPLGHPWVSTHAAPGLWAAEGNAGYPGTAQGWWRGLHEVPAAVPEAPGDLVAVTGVPAWSREAWGRRGPTSLLGLQPDTTPAQVAQALLEAHAFAVRGNVEDLARATGAPAERVVVVGGAARDGVLPALLAAVLGRDVHWSGDGSPAALAGAHLVERAVGAHTHAPGLPSRVAPAGDASAWDAAFARWRDAVELLRR